MSFALIVRIALGVAGGVCLLCILRGVRLIQRAGGGETLRCQAVVRQIQHEGRFGMKTMLLLTVEESVLHVTCHLPGQWFCRVRISPADILPVLWQPGELEAVAERTIRHGQVLFTGGMVFLALIVAAAMQVF